MTVAFDNACVKAYVRVRAFFRHSLCQNGHGRRFVEDWREADSLG